MRKIMMSLLFLSGFLICGTAQNVTLVVTTTNGTEHTHQLTEESLLYFNNGESLVIDDGADGTVTYPLSEIRKVVCSEITGTSEATLSEWQVLPNPSHHSFIVRNLPETCQGRIYALDGRLVKDFEASEGAVIDISGLADGMYLLHINGKTLKLMKL